VKRVRFGGTRAGRTTPLRISRDNRRSSSGAAPMLNLFMLQFWLGRSWRSRLRAPHDTNLAAPRAGRLAHVQHSATAIFGGNLSMHSWQRPAPRRRTTDADRPVVTQRQQAILAGDQNYLGFWSKNCLDCRGIAQKLPRGTPMKVLS
jgi:hypothetical protein